VLHAVPLLPFSDVSDAEIGRQVDHLDARINQLFGLLHGDAVRRGKEHHITGGKIRGLRIDKAQINPRRKLGNMSATGSLTSRVIALISTFGCCASKRSSTPVYPVPPTTPTLIMLAPNRNERQPPQAQRPPKKYYLQMTKSRPKAAF
jgi:hypothetical protein